MNWKASRKRDVGAGYKFITWDSDEMLELIPGTSLTRVGRGICGIQPFSIRNFVSFWQPISVPAWPNGPRKTQTAMVTWTLQISIGWPIALAEFVFQGGNARLIRERLGWRHHRHEDFTAAHIGACQRRDG